MFEKRFTSETDYGIWEIENSRWINEEQYVPYQDWIADGNTPTDIAYVAPADPEPQPPSIEDRMAAAEEALLALAEAIL